MLTSMLAIALAAGTATPAVIAKPNVVTSSSAPQVDGADTAKRVKPTRYCVDWKPTGTRIPRHECRARDAWLERGFDPLAKD